MGFVALTSLCATLPCLGKEHISLPDQPAAERITGLEWVSSYLTPMQTLKAYRALGRLVVLSV